MYGMWVLALMDHLSLALLTSLLRFAKHHLPVWRIGLKKWVITHITTTTTTTHMFFQSEEEELAKQSSNSWTNHKEESSCMSQLFLKQFLARRQRGFLNFVWEICKQECIKKKEEKKEIYCKTHHPPLKMLWELCLLGLGSDPPHDPLQQQEEEEVMNFLCPTKAPTSSCLSPPLPFGRSSSTSSSTNKILCSILIKASSGSWMEDEIDQLPLSLPPPPPPTTQNLWRHGNYSA